MISLWSEKYRPRSLHDIFNHDTIKEHLINSIKSYTILHMIFTGPPGTGKTSSALAFINDFFKIHYNRLPPDHSVLIYNASDELRSNDIENLKQFVMSKDFHGNDYVKFVVLDESDHISKIVQGTIRRIMEDARNTYFIFTNNYIENLIDPIVSRCAIYRFKPIPKNVAIEFAKSIMKKENVSLCSDDLNFIYTFSHGDMRYFINMLQFVTKSSRLLDLKSFFGVIENLDVFIKTLKKGSFKDVYKLSSQFFSPKELVLQLLDYFLHSYDGPNLDKIILCLSEFDLNSINSNNEMSFSSFFSSLSLLVRGEKS